MEYIFDFEPGDDDFGEVQQWEYSSSKKQGLLYSLKFVGMGVLPLPILSMLLPIFGVSNWYIVLFVGGAALLALGIAALALWKNGVCLYYLITDKRIVVQKGAAYETVYGNIKSVKLKKSKLRKNTGTVKIYVKKGWSVNYHIVGIPNPEEVYELITKNMNG